MDNRTAIIKQPDNISSFNDVYKLQKEYQEALILDNSNPDFIWIGGINSVTHWGEDLITIIYYFR